MWVTLPACFLRFPRARTYTNTHTFSPKVQSAFVPDDAFKQMRSLDRKRVDALATSAK
jgi:hypothetical protein